MRRRHWFGEQVRSVQTTLDQLSALLPTFERYGLGRNRFQDIIARRDASGALPVAAVSKRYVLVQHAAAVAAVASEVADLGIDAAAVPATLFISEYGTRVAIRAVLPDECAFVDGDGHKTALTFELFNSVDGTVPLMAAVGWFRFVCSNGMVVGSSAAHIRERHTGGLDPDRVSLALRVGMILALEERDQLEEWQNTMIDDGPLSRWIDGPLCERWGPYAASRVYGIVTTGKDGEPQRRPRKVPPHCRPLVNTSPVPGASTDGDAYAVVQALSWVASRRANITERLQWRADIRDLMDALLAIQSHTAETLASSFEDASSERGAEVRTNELAHDVLS